MSDKIRITLEVNGRDVEAWVTTEPAAERGAAHRGRPDRRQVRLRRGRVRDVHRAARRRPGELLPRLRGPGRRREHHDAAGPRRPGRVARRAAAELPAPRRLAVRVLHARHGPHRALARASTTRTPTARRSARRSPATSAAARATAKIVDAVEAYARGGRACRLTRRLATPARHAVDGPYPRDFEEKVAGALRYADDWALPGMLHGAVVRSSLPCARIVSIDTVGRARRPRRARRADRGRRAAQRRSPRRRAGSAWTR